MNSPLFEMLKQRPLVIDGAMGTMLQLLGPSECACNEELCLSKPTNIEKVHRAYIDAGADVITTNSFGASSIVLEDYDLAGRAAEINKAAAMVARRAADATTGRRVLVAGDVGPTSKIPTLGHIGFNDLASSYTDQMEALISGGVDMLLVETCQDPLQTKAAAAAASDAFVRTGKSVPLLLSFTIEPVGTMLLGTELSAAMTALAPYGPSALGMNCATGPAKMEEHLQYLSANSPFPILCQPNAGMPENVNGAPHYPLAPDAFAALIVEFVKRYRIALVGGCCGTTPDHIASLSSGIKSIDPKIFAGGALLDRPKKIPALASLFRSVNVDQEPKPFIIAEQTNVNGSRKFKGMLESSDFDAMAEVGRGASDASHALDVCVAFAGRNEKDDMVEVVKRLSLKVDDAIMVDSTNPQVIEAALAMIPGRAIINSINLEDGGEKAREVVRIAKRFGAMVVGLTIDEDGMARDVDRKLEVAKRLVDLAQEEGLARTDIMIDSLVFTLASGDEELRRAGINTLEAVRRIKAELPEVTAVLGVSNISFGLPPLGRKYLTSVFLHRALEAGLDAAIINPIRVASLTSVPDDARKLCENIIDDADGGALISFIDYVEEAKGVKRESTSKPREKLSPREALRMHIMTGSLANLGEPIESLLETMKPGKIINEVLLPAMQEVGVKFGSGELALPFVLQSAEAMRKSIDIISPHMNSSDDMAKGTIVLATVRGDVHDVGKNLVDIILSNNGFRVVNLGIRQTASAIMEAVKAENADAIGLSGLLVSSTEIMRQDLESFVRGGISVPVLCGGAALTGKFVDDTLSPAYDGRVFYCPDAFVGLNAMEEVVEKKSRV